MVSVVNEVARLYSNYLFFIIFAKTKHGACEIGCFSFIRRIEFQFSSMKRAVRDKVSHNTPLEPHFTLKCITCDTFRYWGAIGMVRNFVNRDL